MWIGGSAKPEISMEAIPIPSDHLESQIIIKLSLIHI